MKSCRNATMITVTGMLAVAYAVAQPLPGQWGNKDCPTPDGTTVECSVTYEQCETVCLIYDHNGCVIQDTCNGPERYRKCMHVCNDEGVWVDTWCVCACLNLDEPTHENCTASP